MDHDANNDECAAALLERLAREQARQDAPEPPTEQAQKSPREAGEGVR